MHNEINRKICNLDLTMDNNHTLILEDTMCAYIYIYIYISRRILCVFAYYAYLRNFVLECLLYLNNSYIFAC